MTLGLSASKNVSYLVFPVISFFLRSICNFFLSLTHNISFQNELYLTCCSFQSPIVINEDRFLVSSAPENVQFLVLHVITLFLSNSGSKYIISYDLP